MKKKYGRKCPYCGKKVSLFYAAVHLHDGEYTCSECKKYSNVKYNPFLYLFLVIAVILSCSFGFIFFKDSLKGVLMSIIPFIIFYLLFPLFYMLVPIKLKNKNDKKTDKIVNQKNYVKKYIPRSKYKEDNFDNYYDDGDEGSTKYIPNIK